MKTRIRSLSLGAAIVCACGVAVAAPAHGKNQRFKLPPRNVILIIGDGMDSQQITAARNYLVGAQGYLNVDRMPKRSAAQVLSVSDANPDKAVYVSDSASGGTALATGTITSPGRISTTAGTDEDVSTILELAKAAGYRAGVVTSATVTDATPATFLAHVKSRGCEGPSNMTSCPGDVSIAEQIANGKADVVLGAGYGVGSRGPAAFSQTVGGKEVLQIAQEKGFQTVTTAAALDSVTNGRLLGLFGASTMPTKLTGPSATLVAGDANLVPPAGQCTSNPAFNPNLSLATLADKAIELLSKDNKKGFFLMIESASVDKEAHARRACGHIGEMEQLDEVVGMVRDYADDHPGTVIIVTADHGQSVQVLNEAEPEMAPPAGMSPSAPMGYVTQIVTPSDGSVLRIGYATSSGGQEDHTGTDIPVLVDGGLPAFFLKPFIHQGDVFTIMAKHLGLSLE